MNLRIDLILDTEQRSGSLLNAKSLTRLVSILVPLLAAGLIAWQLFIVVGLRKQLNDLILDWEIKQPQSEKAITLTKEFESHKSILRELEGWKKSRIAWNDQISQIMKITPENIQLQTLTMHQVLSLYKKTSPARMYALSLAGKATGRTAEKSVRGFEQKLQSSSAFTGVVEKVTVPQYGEDPSADADRDDRIFQIETDYEVQTFNEITRRRKRKS